MNNFQNVVLATQITAENGPYVSTSSVIKDLGRIDTSVFKTVL